MSIVSVCKLPHVCTWGRAHVGVWKGDRSHLASECSGACPTRCSLREVGHAREGDRVAFPYRDEGARMEQVEMTQASTSRRDRAGLSLLTEVRMRCLLLAVGALARPTGEVHGLRSACR
jgi:hypothetical protein